jgi:hypothetical protein
MTGDWMRALSGHYRRLRGRFPLDRLVVVFDIDGTIVDPRELSASILHAYDRHHGTRHFFGVTAEDIVEHEANVDEILAPLGLADDVRSSVRAWYAAHLRDPQAVAAAHRPYRGVLGVIRWFQLQPLTDVALNTGRPESMRALTLSALNALGAMHKVRFAPDLLQMNRSGWQDDVERSKVEGLRRLERAGHRIVAVVDNEPALLHAMAEADPTGEILFLHADTIFASARRPSSRTVSGTRYELSGLVDEAEVGERVTLAWHGVNDAHNLEQFLGSEVRWAEVDVRRDPIGRLVLRHDSFLETPWSREEEMLSFEECLGPIAAAGRSVKLDLKEREVVGDVLVTVRRLGFADDRLWFNGSMEALGREGFAELRAASSAATLQVPIDSLVPLLLAAPELAEHVLEVLRRWGIDRVSLDWRTPGMREAFDRVERLGWRVNLYGVPDLESFLEAALLLPASVTADFNFPDWSYDGRGPARAVAAAAS